MTAVGQVYYNVMDNNIGDYTSSGINIFNDIVRAYGARQINKLGVQAPPGTQVVINNSKTIMVGRTGIYELDEDIYITNLYFIKPRKYVKDETASAQALEQGEQGMKDADIQRQQDLEQFYQDWPVIPDRDNDYENYMAYWDAYNDIQERYIIAYEEALKLFNQGSNGIYILPNPNNVNAPENYQDLYNVIVDFIYED